MFATVMMPHAFGVGSASPERLPAPVFASSPFRPSRPSPLSSSPIRASSPPTSPQPDTQSSPIHPSSSARNAGLSLCTSIDSSPLQSQTSQQQQQQQQPSIFSFSNADSSTDKKPSLFRFASRPAKPVPRGQQNRDAAQQTRRSLFLRNVRQRADNRNWDRRNYEQELEKLEWWSFEREMRQAKESEAMNMFSEQDVEDAADWPGRPSSSMPSFSMDDDLDQDRSDDSRMYYDHDDDHDDAYDDNGTTEDERMANLLAKEEEAELEALFSSMDAEGIIEPELPPSSMQTEDDVQQPSRPHSAVYSDDGEYEAIFAEIMGEDTDMGLF